MQVPFGEWLPDQPKFMNPGANIAKNVYFAARSYKPFPSLTSYSTNAIADLSTGAGSFRSTDNTSYNFAATKDTLYQLSSAVFTDRGAGGKFLNDSYATCTITVSDAANIAVGSTITITDNAGVSTTMTATNSDPAPALEFSVGGSRTNDDVADNIAVGSGGVLGINNLAGYSAPNPAGGTPVITVTRAVTGDSNLTVTSSDPVRLAVTDFVAPSYTLVGNHTSLWIGTPYESKYTLSPQYVRENTGRGLLAVTTGRYQIRNIALTYENSGFFTAEVTPENRSTSTTVMNGYVLGTSGSTIGAPALHSGTIKVPIQCRNTDFTFDIKSSSHLPMYVASAEVEGYYHNRANRI